MLIDIFQVIFTSDTMIFFSGSYNHLLRLLVSEFTLTDSNGNNATTTSLLRTVCHANDSVILGTWLQETDHRTIEDQVTIYLIEIIFNSLIFNIALYFFTWLNGLTKVKIIKYKFIRI